jgi:hypothetical protein
MTVVQSKYSILSNKPVNREDLGEFTEIIYKLPDWFVNWNKTKIIKVYGCSFAYLDSQDKVPVISTLYANQFISVHSNIVQNDITSLQSLYLLDGYREVRSPFTDEAKINSNAVRESEANEGFMMVVNNFYSPKIFNLTNSTLDNISIRFKDATGNIIPLRTPYYSGPVIPGDQYHTNEIRQAVFKIEIELAIIQD